MKIGKIFIYILFFILFFLVIYEYYIYKDLANKLKNLEMKLIYQKEQENVIKLFNFLNSFAKDSGLIGSEFKILPSGKEYIFIYKFESIELFENFIKEKSRTDVFKLWEESLKNYNVERLKIIDKNDNIIKIIRKSEFFHIL